DLHEVLLAQLAGDRPEDARATRVSLVVDDHRGVLVERDRRAVVAAERLLRAHDDRANDLALLHGALRRRRLHGADDDVADACVAAVVAAHHPDAQQLARAGVVGDLQAAFLLNHFATSTISASRQFFVFESGRVSTMRTTSPTCAAFCSSCAWNFTLRRMTFLYRGCERMASTLTTIVLSIASETTTPRRSWRRPRSPSSFGRRVIGLRSPVDAGRCGRVFFGRCARGSRFFLRFGSVGVSSVVVSFSVSDIPLPLLCRGLALGLDGQDPRDLALRQLQARRVLERTRDRLEAQVEELLAPLGEAVLQLVVGQIAKFARPSQRAQPLSSPLWS